MMAVNSSFSTVNPLLQIYWDSTSIQAMEFCPRYYQYTMIDGWHGSRIDLEFGIYVHSALELYHKLRLKGETRDEAQLHVLQDVTRNTWRDGNPWGGKYEDLWHCTGSLPYKNARGNRAKCPYAHKGVFFPEPAPSICGECGSDTEIVRTYVPDHDIKNRRSLIFAVLSYIEEKPEDYEVGPHAYVFPNGTPAIELSGAMPWPLKSPHGEQYMLTYHFDKIEEWGDEFFVSDYKTTTKPLTSAFWDSYAPSTQIDNYDLIGATMFKQMNIRGVVVEGVSLKKSGVEFGRHTYYKTEGQRAEQADSVNRIIKEAEGYAQEGFWPMRKRSCWLCPFKKVCARDPAERERMLKADFTKGERWDPAKAR